MAPYPMGRPFPPAAMIIDTLRLHPFAACTDETYAFGEGLNVVLGPNEAGKSTLWHAILALIGFADNAKGYDNSLRQSFMPLGGTDHLQVTLGARLPDRRIEAQARLLKSGSKPHLELRTWPGEAGANGATRPATHQIELGAVREELARIRRYSQQVYREVLMISAAGLSRTAREERDTLKESLGQGAGDLIERVRQGQEAARRIGRLRPESTLAYLDKLLEGDTQNGYPGQWDFARQQPRGGRGVDNPWKHNVGLILASWYRWQNASRALEHARANLAELERLEGELTRARAHQANARAVLDAEGAADRVKAAKRLREVTQKRSATETELTLSHTMVQQKAERDKALRDALTERDTAKAALERHIERQAEAVLAGHLSYLKGVLEDLAPLVIDYRRALEAKNALAEPVAPMTVSLARTLEKKITAAEARLSVTKGLSMTLKAQTYEGVKAVWQPLNGPARTINLTTEPVSLDLQGATRLTTPELEVTLSAQTSEDLETLMVGLTEDRRALAELLARHEAETIDHLDTLRREHEKIVNAPGEITVQISQRLDRAAVIEAMGEGSMAGTRPRYQEVVECVRALEAMDLPDPVFWKERKTTLEAEARQTAKRASDLEISATEGGARPAGAPGTSTAAELEAALGQLNDEAARLQTLLPPDADLSDLIKAFEEAQQTLTDGDTARNHSELERQIGALERALEEAGPLAELERVATQARQAHEQHLEEYAAFGRIRERLRQILADEQDRAPGQIRQGIDEAIARLTGGAFTVGRYDDETQVLPESFARQGLGQYTLAHLSQGTADTLGLALRLSLAEGYLGTEGGFVFLDDVMVNMDEARAALATAEIQRFAGRHQVIYLTCHPATAERLGGRLHTLCAP